MFFRGRLLFISIIFFAPISAFSAVFNVVNKADSGPGTFREALTKAAANGTAAKDFITFALPGITEADRTIVITSALPDVSANLVIDGSIQPGSFFGVSHTKVAVFYDVPVMPEFAGLRLVGDDVAIYGLYMKCITNLSNDNAYKEFSGINLISTVNSPLKNLIIGAPGKGNVIMGFRYAFKAEQVLDQQIVQEIHYENIKVQDNFFGIDIDGNTTGSNNYPGAFNLHEGYGDIIIGGLNPGEGNNFATECIIFYTSDLTDILPTTVNIYGNNIGVNAAGNQATRLYGGLSISRLSAPIRCTFNIEDNVIAANWAAIDIINADSQIDIKRNHLGVDRSGIIGFGTQVGVAASNSGNTRIGSDNIEDANIIAFVRQPIYFSSDGDGSVLIKKNSIYCITTLQPMVDIPFLSSYTLPKVEITNSSSNLIEGKATPNSNIELFYTDRCNSCAPETYFGSAITGADGKWRYNGLLTNSVIASANINGRSSEFTKPAINATLDFSHATITTAHCGLSDGSIKNVIVPNQNFYTYQWFDAENNIVGNSIDLIDVAAGTYRLGVNRGNCSSVFASAINISQADGYTIDESSVIVKAATCGNLNGSIKNMLVQGTGAVTFTWTNEQNIVVGNTKDLINIGAGKYRLEVKTSETCPPVYSSIIEIIQKDLITMDESRTILSPAGCSGNTGSIKGIAVIGASKYEWLNEGNTVYAITTLPELNSAPAGKYRLRASNSSCEKISLEYVVASIQPIPFSAFRVSKVYPCTGSKGSLQLIFELASNSPAVRWENQFGATVNRNLLFADADAGTYKLFLTDANNCERLVGTYKLPEVATLQINESSLVITPDACGASIASISGLRITQGKGPFNFTWTDNEGKGVGNTASLNGMHAGTYHLTVTDSTACSATSVYNITDRTNLVTKPEISTVQICAPGDAIIAVNHPQAGSYKLFNASEGGIPLAENNTGIFLTTVNQSTSLYVSYRKGTCESDRTAVQVVITAEQLKPSNTITPNGDGINDVWLIHQIENYSHAHVRIFNRLGNQIFDSVGYSNPFDGSFNGKDLPTGTYYFMIDLMADCKSITGSISIVR